MRKIIVLMISLAAFLALLTPATIKGIIVMSVLGIVGCIVCWRNKVECKPAKKEILPISFLISVAMLYSVGIQFVERWEPSSIVGQIASIINMKTVTFLVMVAVVLAVLSLYFLLFSFEKIYDLYIGYIEGTKGLQCILIVCILILQWIQLQYSALPLGKWNYITSPILLLLNISLICLPSLVVMFVTGKWSISLWLTSVLYSLYSIANYYVVVFHGTPIATSELANFKTAVNVATGYEFFVDGHVLILLVIAILEMLILLKLYKTEKSLELSKAKQRLIAISIMLVNVFIIYIGLFSSFAVKPAKAIGWSWNDAMSRYGYMTCLVEDFGNVMNPYSEPDGYDVSAITSVSSVEETALKEYPDVMLVLNETFFDLSLYMDMETTDEYMESFHNISGAIYGHAITPSIGGGTNNSEFELLTSNSMALLSSAAPFNYVDLTKSDNNIVRYLENFGYKTSGMHCAVGANYSRSTAYPDLGFDNSYFDVDNFKRNNKYGNRNWLDSDNYQDMFELCETNDETPRFMYLLTYQNHGGYEQNEDSFDTVHVTGDYGDLTDDINEYLTSVKMSCDAFVELTEKLKKSDRPTIVCMVGDHAPSFISELECKPEFTEEEKNIYSRMAPYVMWANYDVDFKQTSEYASMVDLVPLMVEAAGFPVSDYYRYILDMHEVLPVRTSDQWYMDADGNVGKYGKDSTYYDLMTQYYYMEYNGLKVGEDYKKELFVP